MDPQQQPPQQPNPAAAPDQPPAAQPAPMQQPATPPQQPQQPNTAQPMPGGEDPGKTMGLVGLILAFISPLIGIIISAIALNKSKKAGFSNGKAKAGLIIGIVLFVIGMLLTVLIFMSAASQVQENATPTTTTFPTSDF